MKAIIYARCSTDEKKQDVEVQLKQLREYCQRQGWEFDEVSEYESGYKGVPNKLKELLHEVGKKKYDVFLVHDLSRFSRQHPATTIKMLNYITENKCRFLALQNNLDSENEGIWYIFLGGFAYFNWIYSRNLSEKTKLGMKNAKEKGKQMGRPKGSKDKKPRSKKGYFIKQSKKLPF